MRSTVVQIGALVLLLLGKPCASNEDVESQDASSDEEDCKNPKMVVFGDSNSDSGRRFNAPASFDFEDIGPFPYKKLFVDEYSDEKFRAYLPSRGSPSNGKVWADWLRVPQDLNFATSSASASEDFRSRETCLGYTGDGEDFPTGTLDEQITRYFHNVADYSDETLGYTHVILIGANDLSHALQAGLRYSLGGAGYEDPVPFENVFTITPDGPEFTFVPAVTAIVTALGAGVTRLLEAGVTGRIVIANITSFRGVPDLVASGVAEGLDLASLAVGSALKQLIDTNPQLRLLDLYTFFAAVVDNPALFEDQGFHPPADGSPFGSPCLVIEFFVDYVAEVMGTQAQRGEGCEDECSLCEDSASPCQNCLQGNPSATVCADPDSRIFWDTRHPTTAAHKVFSQAIKQCTKDNPKYHRAWVQTLCPDES